jgi:hypothetical protein
MFSHQWNYPIISIDSKLMTTLVFLLLGSVHSIITCHMIKLKYRAEHVVNIYLMSDSKHVEWFSGVDRKICFWRWTDKYCTGNQIYRWRNTWLTDKIVDSIVRYYSSWNDRKNFTWTPVCIFLADTPCWHSTSRFHSMNSLRTWENASMLCAHSLFHF